MTPATLEASRFGGDNGSARGVMFHKLRPGPGSLPEDVSVSQRARIEGAMVELVGEIGYSEVGVRGLVIRAGVSSGAFYKHFDSLEECFISSYESVMECSLGHASTSPVAGKDWAAGLRIGLAAMIQDFSDNPTAAQFALVESYTAGPSILEQRRPAMQDFEEFLVNTFANAPGQSAIPFRIVEGISAGIMRVMRTKLLGGRIAELPAVADELTDWSLAFGDAKEVTWGALEQRAINSGQFRSEEERRDRNVRGATGSVRGRILTATAKLSARDGYATLTVPGIRREAGVSRRNFDAHFADVDACFFEAVETLTVAAASHAEGEARYTSSWARGVYQTSVGFCAAVARSPVLAQLAFIEVFAPGRGGLDCREQLITRFASRMRETAPSSQRSSELAAEASMAAAWRMIQTGIAVDGRRQLAQIAPAVAYVLLAPGVGARSAAQALSAEHAELVGSRAESA
jgi:AcrR family transcriptional regulator